MPLQSPDGKYEVHIDRTPASAAAANKSNYDFKPLFAQLDAKTSLPRKPTSRKAAIPET